MRTKMKKASCKVMKRVPNPQMGLNLPCPRRRKKESTVPSLADKKKNGGRGVGDSSKTHVLWDLVDSGKEFQLYSVLIGNVCV